MWGNQTSAIIRQRVIQARVRQFERIPYVNGQAPSSLFIKYCAISDETFHYLKVLCVREKWSNRSQIKVLRIARTIADLAAMELIEKIHVKEAVEWKKASPTRIEENYA